MVNVETNNVACPPLLIVCQERKREEKRVYPPLMQSAQYDIFRKESQIFYLPSNTLQLALYMIQCLPPPNSNPGEHLRETKGSG